MGHVRHTADVGDLTLKKWNELSTDTTELLCCVSTSKGPHDLKYYKKAGFRPYPAKPVYKEATKNTWPENAYLEIIKLTGLCGDDGIALLEGLPRHAPGVRSVILTDTHMIEVRFSPEHALYLLSLARLMEGGLQITGPNNKAICLSFQIPPQRVVAGAGQKYVHLMSHFLAHDMQSPLKGFTAISFSNENVPTRADMTKLACVFPSMKELYVSKMALLLPDLPALAACQELFTLELREVDGFSYSDLEKLCARSKSLRVARVYGCSGFLEVLDGVDSRNVRLSNTGVAMKRFVP